MLNCIIFGLKPDTPTDCSDFSAYIYLSSLTIRHDPFVKNFGTSFLTPLILCVMSFLTLNTSLSESYIFFSEFFLITAVLIILAFKNNKDLSSLINILLYTFPLIIAVSNLSFGISHKHVILNAGLFVYIGIIFAVIILCMLKKRYFYLVLYSGIISLCASLLIPRINTLNAAVIVSLIFKASGYIFFAYFFYKSSVNKLEKNI